MEYLNRDEIDFPTTSDYSKKQIRKVQTELLNMARIVCGILEKHDIPYFIAFGTLMGVVKFKGFLPWDDDIDLFLFDESYDEAIGYLESELPKHLIVHGNWNDPLYFLSWNSVKNTRTEAEDNGIYNRDNRLLRYRCLSVDMYRIKRMPIYQIQSYKKQEAKNFFKRKLDAGIITEHFYEENLKRLEYEHNNAGEKSEINNEQVFTFILKLKKPIKYEHIFPLKKYRFENIDIYGPNNTDEVLRAMFGEYEALPDFEDRKTHLRKVTYK